MDRQSQIELVLDRYENPQYKRKIENADAGHEGGNPGCGDIIHLYLKISNDVIEEIGFDGEGCTISQASTDFLAELVLGKSLGELESLDHNTITELLGEEIVKNRTKCALLPLDTLKISIKKYREKQVRRELESSS